MWEALQYVTSGLTLVAFLVSVIAWAYKSRSEERERLIRSASEEGRGELVRAALEFFDVDTRGLTKEQRYEIALAQIHARAKRFRTTAIVVCVLAFILAGVSAFAIFEANETRQAQRSGNETSRQAKERVFESRSLSSATEWSYPDDIIRLKGTIVTNGKSLTIRGKKLIAEDARIVPLDSPVFAGNGKNGPDGPEGGGGTGAGEAGASGADGGSGTDGEIGVESGAVIVEAAAFEGSLLVSTSGGAGGDGGRGGSGGKGGSGARGEPSRPGIVDCASGPGWGGRGGNGGAAGQGGNGGSGGSAGTILFRIRELFSGSIEAIAKGGAAGEPGSPGTPGQGGAGGPEGQARGLCDPAGRNGGNGTVGAPSVSGERGQAGTDGRIIINLPQLETEANGEYKYVSGG